MFPSIISRVSANLQELGVGFSLSLALYHEQAEGSLSKCPPVSKTRSLAGVFGENLARNFSCAFPDRFSFSLVKVSLLLKGGENFSGILGGGAFTEMSRDLCECHASPIPEQVCGQRVWPNAPAASLTVMH